MKKNANKYCVGCAPSSPAEFSIHTKPLRSRNHDLPPHLGTALRSGRLHPHRHRRLAADRSGLRSDRPPLGIQGDNHPRLQLQPLHDDGDEPPGQRLPPWQRRSDCRFPLSIAEVSALANDIELELATDGQLYAAGIIAAHSPYGQPEVRSRDWRTYVAMLAALGLSIDHGPCPGGWRHLVRDRLQPFRRAAAASVTVAAE